MLKKKWEGLGMTLSLAIKNNMNKIMLVATVCYARRALVMLKQTIIKYNNKHTLSHRWTTS